MTEPFARIGQVGRDREGLAIVLPRRRPGPTRRRIAPGDVCLGLAEAVEQLGLGRDQVGRVRRDKS